MIKLFLSLLSHASALPVIGSPVGNRILDTTKWTCSTHVYNSSDVSRVIALAYPLLHDSSYVGDYPHQYKNREGFIFVTDPPYFEYPIIPDDIYTAGPPGPDRVIFDDDGVVEGLITHAGASGDGFVACKE
ncbi:guanyl-specific ribonuclease [Cercophora samala]|uniref:ribonuclease T1 n=1 Tax=Cercophora samala TaxID=330535 RepID=A0AA40DDE0_9PEZI|nr:guanyl-specific ribonuclease [Cercophora samala]